MGSALLLITLPAFAYLGPASGISFLGSLFSALMVVLLTLGAILIWPLRYAWRRLRRLIREAKQKKQDIEPSESNNSNDTDCPAE